MEKTIKIIKQMLAENIVENYAIAGGVAAIFYMEPILTYDLDVFVFLPVSKEEIISLSPIYEYLKRKGYKSSKEHVIIEGVPVQFIPAYNSLIEEAVIEANELIYQNTMTKVSRIEHLIAIMLQTGRPKDKARITQILDEAKVDSPYLSEVLQRYNLIEIWNTFTKQYYG